MLGAIGGVLLFHPYTMIVYRLLVPLLHMENASLIEWLGMSFSLHMVPMLVFYAFLGAALGLCVDLILLHRSKLADERLAHERRRVAHDTLQDTVLTLSHYIRNANAKIGGYSQRLATKPLASEAIKQHAEIIQNESRGIDTVMAALQCLEDPEARENVGSTQLRMLDIRKQIQQRLDAAHDRTANAR